MCKKSKETGFSCIPLFSECSRRSHEAVTVLSSGWLQRMNEFTEHDKRARSLALNISDTVAFEILAMCTLMNEKSCKSSKRAPGREAAGDVDPGSPGPKLVAPSPGLLAKQNIVAERVAAASAHLKYFLHRGAW